jgi:hypothetical protein
MTHALTGLIHLNSAPLAYRGKPDGLSLCAGHRGDTQVTSTAGERAKCRTALDDSPLPAPKILGKIIAGVCCSGTTASMTEICDTSAGRADSDVPSGSCSASLPADTSPVGFPGDGIRTQTVLSCRHRRGSPPPENLPAAGFHRRSPDSGCPRLRGPTLTPEHRPGHQNNQQAECQRLPVDSGQKSQDEPQRQYGTQGS